MARKDCTLLNYFFIKPKTIYELKLFLWGADMGLQLQGIALKNDNRLSSICSRFAALFM
jgi:hypothetical protein